MEKKFSEICRHVISFFKVKKGAHWGHLSPPPPHRDQGRGSERRMEVGGSDLSEGEVGESWRHLFLFSPATCLFWVFPSQLPNKGKNARIQKEAKGGRHHPILTHPECDHRAGAPMGEIGVVVFLLGG